MWKGVLKQLVSMKGWDADGANATVEWVAGFLRDRGHGVEVFEQEGHKSLIAGSGKIALVGHLDVVPTDPNSWDGDPFRLTEKGGRLYGSGVIDMKAGCAAFVDAFLEHPDFFRLILTSDEEQGGFNGAAPIARRRDVEFAIIGERTNLRLCTAYNAIVWLRLVSRGRSTHASRPWLGENAIERLFREFLLLKEVVSRVPPEVPVGQPTVNLGVVEGGRRPNIVPDFCEAKVDLRVPPSIDRHRLVKDIREALSIEVEVLLSEPPLNTDRNNPFVRRLASALSKHAPVVGTYIRGSSDARFFSGEGIPVVEFGPTGGNMHAPNEWADRKSIELFVRVLKDFVDEKGEVEFDLTEVL